MRFRTVSPWLALAWILLIAFQLAKICIPFNHAAVSRDDIVTIVIGSVVMALWAYALFWDRVELGPGSLKFRKYYYRSVSIPYENIAAIRSSFGGSAPLGGKWVKLEVRAASKDAESEKPITVRTTKSQALAMALHERTPHAIYEWQ